MELSLKSIDYAMREGHFYAMREGHFEAAERFHVSRALLGQYIFQDKNLLEAVAMALINHFDLAARPALMLDANSTRGLCLATYINRALSLQGKTFMTIHTEDESPLRDRVYLVLLPNVLTDDEIGVRLNLFRAKGAFVAGIGAFCERRQRQGYVNDVEVWSPLNLAKVGVNANLDTEPCPLCHEGVPLMQGLNII